MPLAALRDQTPLSSHDSSTNFISLYILPYTMHCISQTDTSFYINPLRFPSSFVLMWIAFPSSIIYAVPTQMYSCLINLLNANNCYPILNFSLWKKKEKNYHQITMR